MDEEGLLELQELVQELVEVAPVEALPVEAIPVHAVGWFARVLAIFARHSYALSFFGALSESMILLGFLIPGGTMVALAAAGGRAAELALPVVVALSTAGMVAGAVLNYLVGYFGLDRVLRHRWAGRFGRSLAAQLERATPLLDRHGWWMMLIAHAFGHGRSSLAMAAGAGRLPLHRFLANVAPAALIWSVVYAGGGYYLAAEWETLDLVLRRMGWLGAGVLIAGLLVWWVLHQRQRRIAARDRDAKAASTARAAVTAHVTTLAPMGPVTPATGGSINGGAVRAPADGGASLATPWTDPATAASAPPVTSAASATPTTSPAPPEA